MAAVTRGYVDGRFGQIHYRLAEPDAADRPALLCFHSSPNSGRLYERFLPVMAADRRVVAPDTPGFGYSDPPQEPPGIEDYAAAMGDLMDALELDRVDLLGYHHSKIFVFPRMFTHIRHFCGINFACRVRCCGK